MLWRLFWGARHFRSGLSGRLTSSGSGWRESGCCGGLRWRWLASFLRGSLICSMLCSGSLGTMRRGRSRDSWLPISILLRLLLPSWSMLRCLRRWLVILRDGRSGCRWIGFRGLWLWVGMLPGGCTMRLRMTMLRHRSLSSGCLLRFWLVGSWWRIRRGWLRSIRPIGGLRWRSCRAPMRCSI